MLLKLSSSNKDARKAPLNSVYIGMHHELHAYGVSFDISIGSDTKQSAHASVESPKKIRFVGHGLNHNKIHLIIRHGLSAFTRPTSCKTAWNIHLRSSCKLTRNILQFLQLCIIEVGSSRRKVELFSLAALQEIAHHFFRFSKLVLGMICYFTLPRRSYKFSKILLKPVNPYPWNTLLSIACSVVNK